MVSLHPDKHQSFQPPYHFIVLPRAFHSIFFSSHSIFHRKKCLRACFKNSLQQHPHAGTLTGGSFACSSVTSKKNSSFFNTSSKANYGLCAETGKTAAAMTNFSRFTKSTELLTAVILGRFAAVFFFFFFLTNRISVHF